MVKVQENYSQKMGRLFVEQVSGTSFADLYYQLCQEYPLRGLPECACGKQVVSSILSALGRDPSWDTRDRSYSFDRTIGQRMVHIGFVIRHRVLVEFWFWVQAGDNRYGSNFAVIASKVREKRPTNPVPEAPYPRPFFYSHNELEDILRRCFELTDILLGLEVVRSNQAIGERISSER
jgi:hypothetical protein